MINRNETFKDWYAKSYPKEAQKMGMALVVYLVTMSIFIITAFFLPWYCVLTMALVATIIYNIRKSKFNQILDKRMDEFENR